jgi:crotonobetainyl-CoA:carnitine CoA-transferase CaiB-like acyl-CoA transferase
MGGAGATGAPQLGQHTEEVLRRLGYDAQRIAALAAEGAIRVEEAAQPR